MNPGILSITLPPTLHLVLLCKGRAVYDKVRWKRAGSGKSSGVRVIYYFYNEKKPLFLLIVFGKSEKVNLSRAERNDLAKLVRILLESYGDGS